MSHLERVIILLDMDCFYCQVEEKLDPKLEGKPIAVVQYNAWRGGGIIAVNYPARDRGVTRHMRGEDAKQKCPDITLVKVPQVRGKADLSKYRDAGKRVADVLQTFTASLERASVDEAYLDVTNMVLNKIQNGIGDITINELNNTYVVDCDTVDFVQNVNEHTEFTESNFKLCIGGTIAEEIRAEVLKQTGYKCSAGIAHNKIMAKLACGLHKPNKQTILPHDAIPKYFKTVPVTKLTGLGGKFGGEVSEELSVSTMGELANFTEKQLVDTFGTKNGSWLYNLARGIDTEPVVTRLISKSIGCCKRFPGRTSLLTQSDVQHWMNELASEMSERLEKDIEENNRKAKQMVISFGQEINNKNVNSSRTVPLNSYEQSRIAQGGLDVIKRNCQKSDGSYHVTFLGISVGNFLDVKKSGVDITSFFKKAKDTEQPITQDKILNKIQNIGMEVDEEVLIDDFVNNSEESDDDVGNHSVYSASTEELEEDPKSYIYFEDIYPEFVSSQPLEQYCKEKKVDDVTSDETEHKSKLEKRRNSCKSFFSKYFESPPGRVMQDQEKLCTNELNVIERVASLEVNVIINNENNKEMSVNNEGYKETEFVTPELSNNFGVKRKSSESNILQFFGKPEEPNEHYCPECKKNIPIQDIFDHSDYHVAKQLQAELNRSPTNRSNNTKLNNLVVKVKAKKPAQGNIAKFFKPI